MKRWLEADFIIFILKGLDRQRGLASRSGLLGAGSRMLLLLKGRDGWDGLSIFRWEIIEPRCIMEIYINNNR